MSFSLRVIIAIFLWVLPGLALAFEPFVVKKIEVDGLQRISTGTVFNYLPIEIGERIDEKLSSDVIRALFKTGFFSDIQLVQKRNVLVIKVIERPTISAVKFDGNKEIDKDKLEESLKEIGLAVGNVFNRSLLSRIEQELRQLYFSRGKYGVQIKSEVKDLGSNRVDIAINIVEGKVAKIKKINIVGNKSYAADDLRDSFKLSTPTMFSFLTGNDQYSQQKLRGDLESLKSYYLNRGFINFSVDSTQVTITPNKKYIYITININEGDRFVVDNIKVAGQSVVSEKEVMDFIDIKKGEIFSRKRAVEIQEKIRERLGDEGYAFSNVNVIPDIKQGEKKVDLTFYVDPGKRVYVRRINIAGNVKTRDEVIRRELRQIEGAWYSTVKLNRSRTRLMLTGFFDDVSIETPRVAGTSDQVDINMKVNERASGNMIASLGFQPGQGVIFNISFTWDNFLGTGKRVSATLNNSEVTKVYNFSYRNPYSTRSGISRSIDFYSRETDTGANVLNTVASYITDAVGLGVRYGFPISEFNTARVGFIFENTHIQSITGTPQEFKDFLANEDRFNTLRIEGGWSRNTRNRAIFPNKGGFLSFNTEIALPGGDLEYYKARLKAQRYFPITRRVSLAINGEYGHGDGYNNTNGLPFFENYFAGGERSVRGYEPNSLGPKKPDINGNAIGGNIRSVGNIELVFPPPFSPNSKAVRFNLFVDAGNVFEDKVNVDEFRYSAGVAATWLTPIGPLTFSWASPFNDQPGDRLKSFQFTIGAPF